MRIRYRPEESKHPERKDNAAGCAPDGVLSQARQVGDDLLAAGDSAIQQALSKNPEAFLAASRQEGGE